MQTKHEIAVFGGGCFWCSEAIFSRLKGVRSVTPGYAGGETENPTYEEVCVGNTGHAEVIKIEFDPRAISYQQLLEVFWFTHDPTSLNRQGADGGTQYRSIILYSSEDQKKLAEESKQELMTANVFNKPIVTEIKLLSAFYEAESYHRDYYTKNYQQPYCQLVISPKIAKFREKFKSLLK